MCFSVAHAQRMDFDTVRRHSLQIGTGYGSYATHDQMGSPFIYSASIEPLSVDYIYRSGYATHNIHVRSSIGGVNGSFLHAPVPSGQIDRASLFTLFDLAYTQLRPCASFDDERLRIAVGGTIDMWGAARAYLYSSTDISSEDKAFSYDMAMTLGASVRGSYSLTSDLECKATVSIPLVGAVIRPPYNFFTPELTILSWSDVHLVGIGGFVSWDASLGASYALSPLFVLNAAFNSRYFRYARNNWASANLEQVLALGLEWRFAL